MNTINALTAITTVGSSTSDSGQRQQFQSPAQPGQTLTGTVLEAADNDLFYLEISGNKILARSDTVSLSPGTKLKLEVLATKPDLELRIVSKSPEMFFGKTLTLLSENLNISSLFHAIQSDLSPIFNDLSSLSQEGLKTFITLQQQPLTAKDSGKNLKQLLDRLGLNLESVFARGNKNQEATQTLKSALLELKGLLEAGSELAETTNKLLGTLELYQLAQLRLSNDNLLIFPLPLPFLNHGYLTVEKNLNQHADKDDNDSQHFSLHVNLEPLGNIEISFLKNTDGLYIRFLCETHEKSSFASSHQEDLKKHFSTDDIIGLSFGVGADDPAQSLIQQLIPEGVTMLDTKA